MPKRCWVLLTWVKHLFITRKNFLILNSIGLPTEKYSLTRQVLIGYADVLVLSHLTRSKMSYLNLFFIFEIMNSEIFWFNSFLNLVVNQIIFPVESIFYTFHLLYLVNFKFEGKMICHCPCVSLFYPFWLLPYLSLSFQGQRLVLRWGSFDSSKCSLLINYLNPKRLYLLVVSHY